MREAGMQWQGPGREGAHRLVGGIKQSATECHRVALSGGKSVPGGRS